MLALFIDPCSRLLFEVMLTEMSHYLKRKNYFTVFGKNIWQSAAICTNIWKPSYSNMHNLLKFYQDIWKLEAFIVFCKEASLCILNIISIWKTDTETGLPFQAHTTLLHWALHTYWAYDFWKLLLEIRVRGDKSYEDCSNYGNQNFKFLKNTYTEVLWWFPAFFPVYFRHKRAAQRNSFSWIGLRASRG